MSRAQYVKLKPVDGDEIEGESIDMESKQSFGNIRDIILTAGCFIACLLAGGLGGWYGHAWSNPLRFSEAQKELTAKGYTAAAQHLGEMDAICPDDKHAPIACRLLLMNGGEIAQKDTDTPTEVSNAFPHYKF